jgi:hypothetical protein
VRQSFSDEHYYDIRKRVIEDFSLESVMYALG